MVELREGQTLAIAGLLQTTTNGSVARVPLLGDLPIVGPWFSGSHIETVETELVVLVTVIAAAKAEAEEAARRVATLTDLAVPDDVARLAAKADAARKELDQARKDHEVAAAFLEQAEAATGDLPDRVALRERLTLLARRAEQAERMRTGATLEGERTEVLAATVAVREEADAD